MAKKDLTAVLRRIGDGCVREATALSAKAMVERNPTIKTFQLTQAGSLARIGRMILHELNIEGHTVPEITEIIINGGEENGKHTDGGDGVGSTDSLPPKSS